MSTKSGHFQYRLYRRENLALRRKSRRKLRQPRLIDVQKATAPNQRWGMDFVSDSLTTGRRFRSLTIVDVFTKECPAIEVDLSLSGERVTRVLDRVAQTRGYPNTITVDNGPEFISTALDRWAFEHGVELHFIRPGKPVENAYTESFNGRFRDECLNQCHFPTLAWARAEIEMWRIDYNEVRPHSALGYLAPRAFATTFLGAVNSKDSTKSDLMFKNDERLSA